MCGYLRVVNVGVDMLSAGFAIAAAVFWWKSARVVFPQSFEGLASSAVRGLPELKDQLERQSRMSAQGAVCAAVSAVLMAAGILLAVFCR